MKIGKNTVVTFDYILKDEDGNVLEDTCMDTATCFLHWKMLWRDWSLEIPSRRN